jgi:hypothetical protein
VSEDNGSRDDSEARDRGVDPVERALEILVYAPLGAGLWIRDLAPSVIDTVVARGRAEVDRRQEEAQRHITTARSMGEVAVAFGVPELRKRANRHLGTVRDQADRHFTVVRNQADRVRRATVMPARGSAPADAPADAPPPMHAPVPHPVDDHREAAEATAAAREAASTVAAENNGTARSASSAHLPIPGYDALSASQVVERLAGLGRDELGSVRDYETSNRNRRTILGKIDQLTG